MVSYASEPLVHRHQQEEPGLGTPRGRSTEELSPSAVVPLARSGSLRVEKVLADQLSEEHVEGWEKLYEGQPTPSNPFLALPWVLGWYDSWVSDAADRVVLIVRQDRAGSAASDIVAIAPMHHHRPRVGPVPLARRLLPVGAGLGPNAYEIPGILCRGDQTVQAEKAIVAACVALPVHWSEIALTPEQGWIDGQWMLGTGAAIGFGEMARVRACVVMPLQDSWDATRSALKRNVKESIRRSANRLAKDGRPFAVVRRGEDLDTATVERFLHLHQARSAVSRATERHHPNSYSDDRNRRMVLEVLPQLGRVGHASVFELYLDGEHVASQLALHSPGTSYVHSSGFREDTWSLGVVTHLQAELIRHAISRGDTMINFSPGPNVSKTRWSDQLWVTHEFAVGAGPRSLTPRFAAFQMLSSLKAVLDAAGRSRSQLDAAQG